MWYFCTIWIPNDVSLYRIKNIQAMLNVRNPETVKLLLLTMNYQLMGLRNGYHLRKSAPVCHKMLKHRETVKFSILKKD